MGVKYNIALVSDYYYPKKGGIESHIHNLALSLKSLGHQVIIITHKYPGHIGIVDNGLKVYYLNIPVIAVNTSFPNLYSNIRLVSIFIDNKIDIVHGHQSVSNLTLEAIFHAKTLGLKTVLTEHSLFELGGFENIIVDRLCNLILKGCDRFISVSRTAKINLAERLGLEWNDVYVIQNAIDTNIFHSKKNCHSVVEINSIDLNNECQDSKIEVETDKHIFSHNINSEISKDVHLQKFDFLRDNTWIVNYKIIIVSRLVKRKGIDILLEAIPMLFKRLSNITVLIVGDGPCRDNLEQMIDYHDLKDVYFCGELNHKSIAVLLRQCDIFINTSLTESFCMAILEAAACGCKIVSTNVGAIHEVLPDSILTLTNNDAEEIVNAVCNDLHKIPSDITDIVERVYHWKMVAEKTLEVYDSIQSGNMTLKTRIEAYNWFSEFLSRMYIVYEYIFVWMYIKLYH